MLLLMLNLFMLVTPFMPVLLLFTDTTRRNFTMSDDDLINYLTDLI